LGQIDRARLLATLAGLVLVLAGIAFAWSLLPLRQWAEGFESSIHRLGAWAPIVFALVYIIAVLALVPATTVTLAAGFAFGLSGLPLAFASATIASGCAFLISRYLLAGRVKRLIEDLPRSRALYTAVGEAGWRIVLLLRLSPVMPFSVLNYALGATELRFWPYVLATAIGIVPVMTLYVYLGALGEAALASAPLGTARTLFLLLGLAATLAATIYLARTARANLATAALAEPVLGGTRRSPSGPS
jgi:uncharacterized membrane protein YdjX (TVP38/TMEM64 family)